MGAFLLSQLAAPAVKTPAPVAVAATISDDMVIQVVRAEQALADTRKAEVSETDPAKLKATPPNRSKVAARKPKATEVAVATLPPPAAKANAGEPLVLSQITVAPAQTQPAPQPEVRHEERGVLRNAWDSVAAIPDKVRSTAAWLMDDTPPRPPMPLPDPQLKVTM